MSLQAVPKLDYGGASGVDCLRSLRQDFTVALDQSDWDKIQILDQACVALIDKIIAANKNDLNALLLVLGELKNVYKNMIMQCKYEVNSIVH